MLATLREPPPRGSAQSYVLQALVIRKDQIEYMRTRALIQTLYDKEKANEALKDYREAQMPYYRKNQQDDRQRHIKLLMQEVSRGPIGIAPVMTKQVKSKLRQKVIQRSSEEQLAQSRRVSNKIGGIV